MRYYKIRITDPTTGALVKEWTSHPNGVSNTPPDPGALDIEMDIPVWAYNTPMAGAFVRLWGISLQDISASSGFNPKNGSPGKNIAIFGGMGAGLPLSNQSESGLLASGTIQQAFANWIGVDMTLDILFTAGDLVQDAPVNLVVQWPAGQQLSEAIRQTLETALPGYTPQIDIKQNLVLPNDEPSFHGNLLQLSTYCNEISKSIVQDENYQGVSLYVQDKTIIVSDGSANTGSPIPIPFNDLVGQITWIASATVSITTVMQSKIKAPNIVTLPKGQVTTTAQSASQYRDASTFQGKFIINNARHVGRFRNPSGSNWVTVFEASSFNG